MEHRCTIRRALRLNAAIRYNSLGLITGQTRDIGLGGAFVEIHAVRLPLNTILDVAFFPGAGKRGKPLRYVRAMVTRSATDGYALMFTDVDDVVHTTLSELIQDPPHAAPMRAMGGGGDRFATKG